MRSKKRLIGRMATVTGVVLALGVPVALVTEIITRKGQEGLEEQYQRERMEHVEAARAYLGDLAKEITAVPVDPRIVGEIQARYFQDVTDGPRFLWGMGADGEFLFGVPQADFARLNTAWDAHEVSITAAGVFVDRQDFLLRLVHLAEGLDQSALSPDPGDPEEPWARLRRWGHYNDLLVFSAPLAASDGTALGNLYLQMGPPRGHRPPWDHAAARDLVALAGGVCFLAALFLWFLVPTWVYVDARERGMARALLWSFLALIAFPVGLVVYLIARPEGVTLRCPGCEGEVNGGAFCPHCGRDLSATFCSTCRYPLEGGWAFCPSCRTEVRRPAIPPDAPEEAEGTPGTAEGS